VVPIRTVEKGLALPKGQEPAADEAVVHEAVSSLLERRPEINEYVGANDEMEIVERSIGDQAVAGPGDAALELSIEACGPASDGVVVRQGCLAARRRGRLLVSPNTVEGIGAHPGRPGRGL